jgi:hypothetical protein
LGGHCWPEANSAKTPDLPARGYTPQRARRGFGFEGAGWGSARALGTAAGRQGSGGVGWIHTHATYAAGLSMKQGAATAENIFLKETQIFKKKRITLFFVKGFN